MKFLEKRQRIAETLEQKITHTQTPPQVKIISYDSRKRTTTAFFETNRSKVPRTSNSVHRKFRLKTKCPYCSSDTHPLAFCTKYSKLVLPDRYSIVKQNNLCKQCLKKHGGPKCFSKPCTICSGTHHELLHVQTKSSQEKTEENIPVKKRK